MEAVEEEITKGLEELGVNIVDKARSERSQWCALEKAADAVVCQIFAFLNVRDHWKLSQMSIRMETVSRLPKATPVEVEITRNLDDKVVTKLVKFRPTRLTLHSHTSTLWMKEEKMPQLRELTFCKVYFDLDNVRKEGHDNIQWFAELVNLTKLKILGADFTFLPLHLHDSLLHLHLSGDHNGGFTHFHETGFLRFTNAENGNFRNLQTLKLPNNQYYGKEMLALGTKFPLLREFSIGYFVVQDRGHIDLLELASFKNLESLTIGLDYEETIIKWESLAKGLANEFTALRRLNIRIYQQYQRISSATAFDGLAQVRQLTHLKFISHNPSTVINISAGLNGLVTQVVDNGNNNNSNIDNVDNDDPANINTADPSVASKQSTAFQPTSLLMDGIFRIVDTSHLSCFAALTEFQTTHDTELFPRLPLLHTLHTVIGDEKMRHYENQIRCVVLKDRTNYFGNNQKSNVEATLRGLLKIPQLTTVKLQPNSTFINSTSGKAVLLSTHTYFRRHLPSTIQIETDDSAQD